jgi:hypothetical protein
MPHVLMEEVHGLMSATLASFQERMISLFRGMVSMSMPPTSESTVGLWASEIGSYLGTDSWSSRDKALAKVWKRTNEAHFAKVQSGWRAAGCRVLPAGADLGPTLALDHFPAVKSAADVSSFRKHATPGEVLRLYKSKGIQNEEAVAAMFADSIQQPVMMRHAAVQWRSGTETAAPVPAYNDIRPLGEIADPGPFTIIGQVDGWLLAPPYAGTIVEIKVRMESIPPIIPERDLMQVQAYLHMNNTEECMYVQNLFGTSILQSTHIQRDRALWASRIMPGLVRFVCDIRRLLRGAPDDFDLRHRVLAACETEHPTAKVLPPPVSPIATKVVPPPPSKKRRHIAVMPAAALPPPGGHIAVPPKKKKNTDAKEYQTRSRLRIKT